MISVNYLFENEYQKIAQELVDSSGVKDWKKHSLKSYN